MYNGACCLSRLLLWAVKLVGGLLQGTLGTALGSTLRIREAGGQLKVLGYRDLRTWEWDGSSCGVERQQSPIVLHEGAAEGGTVSIKSNSKGPVSIGANVQLIFEHVSETKGFYKLNLTTSGPGDLYIDGVLFEFVESHIHLGGAEHPIYERSGERVDATLHVVHKGPPSKGLAVVEVQLIWDSKNGVDIGLNCEMFCTVCGKNGPCIHRSLIQGEDNFCGLELGDKLIPEKGKERSVESLFDWLGIDGSEQAFSGWLTYGGGGRTTPPCDGDVRFIVRPEPVRVQPLAKCEYVRRSFGPDGNVRLPEPKLKSTKVQSVD